MVSASPYSSSKKNKHYRYIPMRCKVSVGFVHGRGPNWRNVPSPLSQKGIGFGIHCVPQFWFKRGFVTVYLLGCLWVVFKDFSSLNLLLLVLPGKTDANADLYGESYTAYRQSIAKQHAGKKRTAHKTETLFRAPKEKFSLCYAGKYRNGMFRLKSFSASF